LEVAADWQGRQLDARKEAGGAAVALMTVVAVVATGLIP